MTVHHSSSLAYNVHIRIPRLISENWATWSSSDAITIHGEVRILRPPCECNWSIDTTSTRPGVPESLHNRAAPRFFIVDVSALLSKSLAKN